MEWKLTVKLELIVELGLTVLEDLETTLIPRLEMFPARLFLGLSKMQVQKLKVQRLQVQGLSEEQAQRLLEEWFQRLSLPKEVFPYPQRLLH